MASTVRNNTFGGLATRFVSWNVKGLNSAVKRSKIFTHLRGLKTDIAFLQETHLKKADQVRLKKQWVGQIFHSSFDSKTRGTAIIIHKRIKFTSSNCVSDPQGRYVIVSGQLFDTPVVLVNLYAPNWDDESFVQKLIGKLPDLTKHFLILGADLNCVMNPTLDRSNPKTNSLSKMARAFLDFFQHIACVDPWRWLNPNSKTFSFFSNVHHSYSRIDYFFIDQKLLSSVLKIEYSAIVESDHAPICLDLSFQNNYTSRPQWRFNTALLSDENFCSFISIAINNFLLNNESEDISPSLLWETFKAVIRGEIIAYSASNNKIRQMRKQELTKAILELDHKYSTSPDPLLYKERISLQSEYNLLSTSETERQLLKSRGWLYEHGEKAGRLLAHQLKSKSALQFISEIENDLGQHTTDPRKINDTFQKYYSNLYKSESLKDPSLFCKFFDKIEVPTLSRRQKENLDEDLELGEILSAISAMQSGKAPGPDGFPIDFYKKFSAQLAPLLLGMFNESLEQGRLPESLNEATITLLLKPGRDASKCGSYRPVSLLNSDFKILSKLLAMRLDTSLPCLISEDQTGFIRGRFLFSNVRRLLNVLYSPSSEKVPEVVVSLDAEKAFDRVEMDYLFFVLERFGFGVTFRKWINVLYYAPKASVITNQLRSQNFTLSRGTRQGCPLSPLLFTLAIEPLSIFLKSIHSIHGILRGGLENRLSLYADDMLLYISDPVTSIAKIVSVLQSFGQISGYKLNLSKSECFPVNKPAMAIPDQSLPFKISKNGFKYLGINITPSFQDLFHKNIAPLVSKVKSDLQKWDVLQLTLAGRVNCIKMNILPRFLFVFQCLPIFLSKSFFSQIDKMVSQFIWNKQNPRISKDFLQRQRLEGGLALPNLRSYYWSANIHKITYWMQSPDTNWCELESRSCVSTSLPALVSSNIPVKMKHYTSNPVVTSTLKIWNQFRRHIDIKHTLLSQNPICNNHNFLPAKLDQMFTVWHRKGLRTFGDFYENETFSSFNDLCSKYELPQTDLFRFFQVRNYAKTVCPQFPVLPEKSLLDSLLEVPFGMRGCTARLYSIIMSTNKVKMEIVKSRWEKEIGMVISEDVWEEALKRVNGSTSCARLGLIQFKVVHRLHWSRAKISSFYPHMDSRCVRCHAGVADLTHMFWSCHTLTQYWSTVFNVLSEVLEVRIEPCVIVAIFGVPPDEVDAWTKKQCNIISFVTLLARRQILLNWKSNTPPTAARWLQDVMMFLHLEKIKFTIRRSDKFLSVWGPLISYFDGLDTLPK